MPGIQSAAVPGFFLRLGFLRRGRFVESPLFQDLGAGTVAVQADGNIADHQLRSFSANDARGHVATLLLSRPPGKSLEKNVCGPGV